MKIITTFLALFLLINLSSFSKEQKPYILAVESTNSISELTQSLKENLNKNNFKILGEYMPANDKNRYVIVVTNNDLLNAVKKFGGLRAFAAATRIAITKENGKTLVSYLNPIYWGNAYFQDDYDKIKANIRSLAKKLKMATALKGKKKYKPFGSKDGIDEDDLRDYHYMITMPYFEDIVELAKFKSHKNAVDKIEKNLKKNKNTKRIYRVDVPGKNLTLFGVGLSGKKGESNFLPTIDNSHPKKTAFLPYEILVNGNAVIMLHGRYRIAISFPDLGMVTFTKIISAPGNIESMMKSLTK